MQISNNKKISKNKPNYYFTGVIFLTIIFFALFGWAQNSQAATCSNIQQYGITWTFDASYECGQFVNGDWWVAAPTNVALTNITPAWDGTKHGSVIDPPAGVLQGYDTRASNYSAALTANTNVSVGNPLLLTPNQSLVSAMSLDVPYLNGRSFLKTAAVLSVLGSTPPADAFRPPYIRGQKPLFRTANIQRNLLPNLAPVGPTLDASVYAQQFQRVWLDHIFEWPNQHIHPVDNMPVYSRDMAVPISEAALLLTLQNPNEQLLINFLQLGIDYYYVTLDDNNLWRGNGGHGNGRKWPIVFAGVLFNNDGMKHVSATFGEDQQTYYYNDPALPVVDAYGYPERGVLNWMGRTALFGIAHVISPQNDHEHLNPADWTEDGRGQTRTSPTNVVVNDPLSGSNSDFRSEAYRQCCTSYTWVGYALAARLMNAMGDWNHPAFFDYVDQWMQPNDPNYLTTIAQYSSSGAIASDYQGSSLSPFVDAMWAAYRDAPVDTVPPSAPQGLGVS